ncbi:hypothetical protein ACQKP7_20480 [Pseudomonas frederiksbergensis]|uniref:hypothetical protein n=1 Tax=Pseudomonas frederiksbergensis TaxID=104087 RepID=UPI003CFD3B16
MERSHAAFPEITLTTVGEFVEGIGDVFCVGRTQSEKLSLARSYSTKQDRYQELTRGRNSLFDAMIGRSIYEAEDNSVLVNMLERHFGHMQQLVSWIRSSPVYNSNSLGELNQELISMIAVPQLAMLLTQIEPILKNYSPLKHVSYYLNLIYHVDNEPVRACRIAFRELLSQALQNKKAPDLSIRKSLNSLDTKNSKFTATQVAELKTLDGELSDILELPDRRRLVDTLTGVYAAMMALNRLKKIMDAWSSQAFSDFIAELSELFYIHSQKDSDDMVAVLNDRLLGELYNAEKPEVSMSFTPETCLPYTAILCMTSAFSPPNGIGGLDEFLKKGILISNSCEQVKELRATLQNFQRTPFFEGVDKFIAGILALYDGDRKLAESSFQKCLSAARRWPLGILEHHAALFCIGLAMSEDPSRSTTKINPLLAIYLESMPQLYTIQLVGFTKGIMDFNLNKALIDYNAYCLQLNIDQQFLFNPLEKVEHYLKKIFDWIDDASLEVNDVNIIKATRAVSTKRDIQRVRPYLVADRNLINWLASDSPGEIFQFFPSPESLKMIPYVCRLFGRGCHYPSVIARELGGKNK